MNLHVPSSAVYSQIASVVQERRLPVDDPGDLLIPSARLFLPVGDTAFKLQHHYNKQLTPDPVGVYLRSEIDPRLLSGRVYYSQDKPTGPLELKDLPSLVHAVYDEGGNIILSDEIMRNQEVFLTTQPSIPARGLRTIRAVLEHYVANRNPWQDTTRLVKRMYDLVNSGHEELIDEKKLEDDLDLLVAEVSTFMGDDDWHIYSVNQHGQDILVEKFIDWRVYDWTRSRYEKHTATDE